MLLIAFRNLRAISDRSYGDSIRACAGPPVATACFALAALDIWTSTDISTDAASMTSLTSWVVSRRGV